MQLSQKPTQSLAAGVFENIKYGTIPRQAEEAAQARAQAHVKVQQAAKKVEEAVKRLSSCSESLGGTDKENSELRAAILAHKQAEQEERQAGGKQVKTRQLIFAFRGTVTTLGNMCSFMNGSCATGIN